MDQPRISRRQFHKITGLTAATALMGQPILARAAQNTRPNLLYVFADQLGTNHCQWAGAESAHMPSLSRFAREGTDFRNAVSTMPVCSAHRASLLTGKYPTSTGMVINELRMNTSHRCIGHVLTENDYETCYIGKWHLYANQLGNHTDPANSHIPRGPDRLGFEGFWAAYNFHHVYYNTYYHTESPEKISYGQGVYEPDGQTDLMIDWLKKYKKNPAKPFAAFLSIGTPHDPWGEDNVPAEYLERFKDVSLPNPPNYKPENDEPYTDGWGRFRNQAARERLEDWRRVYYAMNTNLDHNFGRLMKALDDLGLAKNTIVCFSSDHGEMFGAQGRRAKNIFYEEAARVPFLIRWPKRIPAARTADACLATVDVMPTLLGLMDLPIPDSVEGTDMSLYTLGRPGPEPEAAFLQNTGACAIWADGHEWRAVRDKRYTWAKYRVDGQELLFDNIDDPYQMQNLVDDPNHADELNRLRTFAQAKMKELNDTFPASSFYEENWISDDRLILRGAKG